MRRSPAAWSRAGPPPPGGEGGAKNQPKTGEPFLGDAIADPLSGIAAATAAAELVAAGRSGLVDVAMAGVAASFAPRRGPT